MCSSDLEPLSLLSLGIQSHQHFPFGVQSHHHFSVSAFRAIITSQSWHSEPSTFSIRRSEPSPLLSFGVQSHHHFSVLAFSAISIFHSAFTAITTSQFRRSEPSPLHSFGVQGHHHFSVSAFRAIITSQFRRSEPSSLFSLGIQSHQHFPFSVQSHHLPLFWCSEPLHHSFRCPEPLGTYPFRHLELFLSLVSAFRAIVRFGIQ